MQGSGFEREKVFQADRASELEVRRTPDSVIRRHAATRHWRLFPQECVFRLLAPFEDRHIFDFGCGEGVLTTQLARLGARVTGVDISDELIEVAARRAELDEVSDRVRLLAGNVLDMEPTADVDALLCAAVLHHVDLHAVFPHLLRFVKPGGLVVVQEPIAFSPRLQRLRDRAPVEKDVSPDERQLVREDIDFVTSRLEDVRSYHFRMAFRLVRLFRSRSGHRHPVVFCLAAADRMALSLAPPLKRFAGVVVLTGRRPADL